MKIIQLNIHILWGVFSNFDIDTDEIESMVDTGYDQASKQSNIIDKFIINDNINSESLSQSESDVIHKIISDVENKSINSSESDEETLSDDSVDDLTSKNIIIYEKRLIISSYIC